MQVNRKLTGFTLVELLVTITVVAVLATLGLPAFNGFIQNNRTISTSNSFLKALTVARSEAAKRNRPVTICTSADGQNCLVGAAATQWENGWLVFADTDNDGIVDVNEDVVLANPGLAANFTLRDATPGSVFGSNFTFGPTGETGITIPPGDVFRLCRPDGDITTSRNIVLNNVGRARIVEGVTACP